MLLKSICMVMQLKGCSGLWIFLRLPVVFEIHSNESAGFVTAQRVSQSMPCAACLEKGDIFKMADSYVKPSTGQIHLLLKARKSPYSHIQFQKQEPACVTTSMSKLPK